MDTQNVTAVAEGISNYGMAAITAAFFLILSAALMITCFRWFKSVIESILTNYSKQVEHLQGTLDTMRESIVDLSEALVPETQLKVKNIASVYFENAAFKSLGIIEKVRRENHIVDRDATHAKIVRLVTTIHNDRNSRLDYHTYRGRRLSEFCNKEWIDSVSAVIENEIYHPSGANEERAKTNVASVYDDIKIDFYERLKA